MLGTVAMRVSPPQPWILWFASYLLASFAVLWQGTHTGTKAVFLGLAVLLLTLFLDRFSRKTVSAVRTWWWLPVLSLILLGGGGLIDVTAITQSSLVGALILLATVLVAYRFLLSPLWKKRNKGEYSRLNQSLSDGSQRILASICLALSLLTLALALYGY
jgi:uncharacterized membrane protein (DUF485 family)